MAQNVLDYQSAQKERRPPSEKRVLQLAGLAVAVTAAVNGVLIGMAASDRSWGAFGIVIMVGPIANGILILLSLSMIPIVRRACRGTSISLYIFAGVLTPIAAIIIDAICIFSMDLHGC